MTMGDRLDQLLGDLTLDYRPQRQWVEGRGLFLVIAHFFTGIGAGAWIFSWIVDYQAGLVTALILTSLLGGGGHLLFLGRWQRFWRIIRRPHQSWISRGFLGIIIFIAGGSLYVVPAVQDSAWEAVALGISLTGAGAILTYQGFVLVVSRAIPFWRSPLLPPLYAAYALRGGAAVLLLAAALADPGFDVDEVEVVKLWVVVSTALLVLLYLAVASNAGTTARRSVQELVTGRISPLFYGAVVLVGLLIPIAAGAVGYASGASRALLGLVGSSSLVGDFYIKYCILKAGIYLPITAGFPGPGGPSSARESLPLP